MKIECQLILAKNGKTYYLYIPILEKRIFLEPVEQKLINLIITEQDKKSETK